MNKATMRRIAALVLVLLTLGLAERTPAAPKVQQVVIALNEFAFTPRTLTLQVGAPVELTLRNTGQVAHDLELYPAPKAAVKDWDEYAMANTYFKDMGEVAVEFKGRGHVSATSLFEVSVEPGQTAVISFTPNRPGTFEMGCHTPTHYEGGMKGTIVFK